MPKGIDWVYLLYINLAFFALTVSIYIYGYIEQIKADWPTYRCNPMFMPLSDNIEEDFTYCVQNMQTNFMGYLLEPLTYVTNTLSSMGLGFTDALNSIRTVISNIRTFLSSIVDSIMGVFLNITIEFQKITIGIRDLVGKIIGIMVIFMYMMDGSVKTMQSAWNGPSGQMVRVMGSCFDPETLIQLQNGSLKKIKDIRVGDTLTHGSIVTETFDLHNSTNEVFYRVPGGVNGSAIWVTGTHYIFYKNINKYILVRDHPDAVSSSKPCIHLSCLNTSNHTIVIGQQHFYDYSL
jgi:hypothetical protein